MNARISEKGQAGDSTGAVLDFDEEDGQLIARKSVSLDPVDTLDGTVELPARPDALLDELRGPRP